MGLKGFASCLVVVATAACAKCRVQAAPDAVVVELRSEPSGAEVGIVVDGSTFDLVGRTPLSMSFEQGTVLGIRLKGYESEGLYVDPRTAVAHVGLLRLGIQGQVVKQRASYSAKYRARAAELLAASFLTGCLPELAKRFRLGVRELREMRGEPASRTAVEIVLLKLADRCDLAAGAERWHYMRLMLWMFAHETLVGLMVSKPPAE